MNARDIPLSAIHPNPQQPRKLFDAAKLQELADSIKTFGLLQPISVRQVADGTFEIIAGERRFRALCLNAAAVAPCIILDVDDQRMQELAIVENINREDMTLGETAQAYASLMTMGYTLEAIAERTGKHIHTVRHFLDYLQVAPHLQKLLNDGTLQWGLCEFLARLSPAGQETGARAILDGGLGYGSARRCLRAIYNREQQITMFAEVLPTPARQQAAHACYAHSMDKMTAALAELDDDTMATLTQTIDAPSREVARLDLMIKQLRRMQFIVEQRAAPAAAPLAVYQDTITA